MAQTQLADVIDLVVANYQWDGLSNRDVCSLLVASSSCRRQLQQPSVLGHLLVDTAHWLDREQQDPAASVFASFKRWFPKHAGLVSGLWVRAQGGAMHDVERVQQHIGRSEMVMAR
jgi:hypothetical protein